MVHHRSVKSRARCEAASRKPVGEVARGLSLFGGASSEVRRCNCSVVDESRSSLAGLAARCVSFYQTSIYRGIKRTIAAARRQRGARQLRRSGSSLAIGEAASQSLALTECTHARARHTATRTRARRNARIVRHARSTARHPPAPPTIAPRCIMASMPATTLATADKMTQRSTIGASSRSSLQPRAPHASSGMPNVVDRGVAAGSTSRWRASRSAGGR